MSNVTVNVVQKVHNLLEDSDSEIILMFIEDAEARVKARLSSYVKIWTNSDEPSIIRMLIKHYAAIYSLRHFFGNETEEMQKWLDKYEDRIDNLLESIIQTAKEGRRLPDGLTAISNSDTRNKMLLNTINSEQIFNLQSFKDQKIVINTDDFRYGWND